MVSKYCHHPVGFDIFFVNIKLILENMWSLSIHNGVIHKCEYCAYKATQKICLRKHVASIHDGVKHGCKYCDYKATTKDNLSQQVQITHDD